MKGRRPKPTALKILQGNPGHRPIDTLSEPQPVIGLVEAPAYLDDEAKRFWMSEGPQLVKLGTLGESDAGLFALLCQAHSRNLWLSGRIDALRKRKTLTAADERKMARFDSAQQRGAALYAKLAAEFGMGAVSRTRIRIKPNDGQGELPLEDSPSPLQRSMSAARA